MAARVQKAAIIMLAVDLNQMQAHITQQRGRTGLVVDKRLASAIGTNRAADHQRLSVLDRNIVLGKQRDDIGRGIKTGCNLGLFRA